MNEEQRQEQALHALCVSVQNFGAISLATLGDEFAADLEKRMAENDAMLVTQIEASQTTTLRITIMLKTIIDGETNLKPLLVMADIQQTIN